MDITDRLTGVYNGTFSTIWLLSCLKNYCLVKRVRFAETVRRLFRSHMQTVLFGSPCWRHWPVNQKVQIHHGSTKRLKRKSKTELVDDNRRRRRKAEITVADTGPHTQLQTVSSTCPMRTYTQFPTVEKHKHQHKVQISQALAPVHQPPWY